MEISILLREQINLIKFGKGYCDSEMPALSNFKLFKFPSPMLHKGRL